MLSTDKLYASGEDISVETMSSNNSFIPAKTPTERLPAHATSVNLGASGGKQKLVNK